MIRLFVFIFQKKRKEKKGRFVFEAHCLEYLFNVCSDGLFFFFLRFLSNICASAGLRVEAPGRNRPPPSALARAPNKKALHALGGSGSGASQHLEGVSCMKTLNWKRKNLHKHQYLKE